MSLKACCTCATLLSSITSAKDEKSEKAIADNRKLECCGRIICGTCIAENHRFATYCPYCQTSSEPSTLPHTGRLPPAYSPPSSPRQPPAESESLFPPPYSCSNPPATPPADLKSSNHEDQAPDVLHFVHPEDSLSSLSLAYGVTTQALRKTNHMFSDHLLAGRQTLLIPGEFYKGGISLSPRPVVGEEEEARRQKVRRWMVACKESKYDIALLYLQQLHYNLDAAIAAYKDDEKWEKANPLGDNVKGKKKKKIGGWGLTGQLG